jgi:hypothetical protein
MTLNEKMLGSFHPTTLEDLNGLKLLSRYDTKFIFHQSRLDSLLDYLSKGYRILEIGGRRRFSYETLYYDTDDFFFYHQHHNRTYGRYKVRCRRYVESGQCFFEVKFKNNKRKTIKSRLPLKEKRIHREISESSKEFARSHILLNDVDIMEKIKPKLTVNYSRMTFANATTEDRFTIDTGLAYSGRISPGRRLNGLVIAEHKKERFSPNAPLFQHLKGMDIHPVSFSKYCMGIALTEENIKHNRFKKKILALRKMD